MRALRYAGARFLVARFRLAHAKATIWNQTLLPLLHDTLPQSGYTINRSDLFIHIHYTGSEIWLGGFDEKERIEKMLGSEYLDVYFNEVSQISYEAVSLGISRLAQKIVGAHNKAYFDCNPPAPYHWSHRLFIEKRDPKGGEALPQPDLYGSLLMNPIHNLDNLPDHYIEEVLDTLSDRARRRFKYGEWVAPEGTVFDKLDESCIINSNQVPAIEEHTVGVDFGLNMAAVLIGWCGDHVYILGDYGGYNTTASKLNTEINELWGSDREWTAYGDPSGGERLQEIRDCEKANNKVDEGIDYINTLIENKQFHICEKATGVLSEIFDYHRDGEKIVKENDHYMDATRYGIYSRVSMVEPRIRTI